MSFGLIGLIALYWVGAYIFAIILIGVVFENQEDKTNQTTGDNKSEHEGSPFDSKQGTFAFIFTERKTPTDSQVGDISEIN